MYNTSDLPKQKQPILDKPILCYFYAKDPCPDAERKNLKDVDRFEGFTKYIYWTEGA